MNTMNRLQDLIGESPLDPSILMQNLPFPSGRQKDTLSLDYEQDRFFLTSAKKVWSMVLDSQTTLFSDLFQFLDNNLKELNNPWVSGLHEFTFNENQSIFIITRAMRNWLIYPEDKENPAPLEFTVYSHHLTSRTLSFCSQRDILQYLLDAIRLVKSCFPTLQELQIEPEKDPETDDEWLVLDVTVKGDVNEILDQYDNYTDQWVSSVPWPERNMIRLSYHLI
jgi:hypothetical protein